MQMRGRASSSPWATGVTRLVVQDRRRLVCSGLALLADAEDDIDLVGAVHDDQQLRELVAHRTVDVVVLEVRVDDWPVAELVADVHDTCGPVRVIGLHAGRRSDHVAFARAAGISLLLPYGASADQLFEAVRGAEPDPVSTPVVDRRVLHGRGVLTPREHEVLRHISAGLTTQQSAQLLEVSPKTVDNHKQRMFAKLRVQNQAHAVAVAHRAGILRPQHSEASGA